MDFINEIIVNFEETKEDFIFTTIQPFCEDFTQEKISKQELKKALTLYFKAKEILIMS